MLPRHCEKSTMRWTTWQSLKRLIRSILPLAMTKMRKNPNSKIQIPKSLKSPSPTAARLFHPIKSSTSLTVFTRQMIPVHAIMKAVESDWLLLKSWLNCIMGRSMLKVLLENGTTFNVQLPLGHTHLSDEQIVLDVTGVKDTGSFFVHR